MIRRLAVLLALSWVAVPLAGSGQALARERFQVGGWLGAAETRKAGGFAGCRVVRQQSNGLVVIFYLSRDGRLFLAVSSNEFDFMQEERFTVRLRIDDAWRSAGDGRAINHDMIMIGLPDPETLFGRLRQGSILVLGLRDREVGVSLSGTSAALERMRQCVWNGIDVEAGRPPRYSARRRVAAAAAPRTSGKGADGDRGDRGGDAARGRAGDDAARRLEAVTYVANLLARAGFRDYRILDQKEARKRAGSSYDVIWRTSVSVGALRIVSGAAAKNFDGVAASTIVAGAQACKGAFRSGVKREPNSPVLRFFTQCDGEDGWNALFALVRGAGGKVYLVLSLGNGLSDRDDGAHLREVDERIVKAMTAKPLD